MGFIRSSLVLTLVSAAGSLLGLLNHLLIAYIFGASIDVDVYLMAASVPTLISGALTAAFSFSMVPVLMEHQSTPGHYATFAGLLLLAVTILAIFVSLIGYTTAPNIIALLGDSLSAKKQEEAVYLARISWATASFAVMAGCLTAMHNASLRFYIPALSTMVPVSFMILFTVIGAHVWGIAALAWGMLVGSIAAAMLLLTKVVSEVTFSRSCLGWVGEVTKYFSQTPLVLMAMLCFTAYQSIDAYWASRLGPGNLAYLGYSQRILIAIGNLIIAGPAIVMVPRLVEALRTCEGDAFLNQLTRIVRVLIALGSLLALVTSVLAIPLIELVFQRGAFDEVATSGLSLVLPLMMVGMVAMVCMVVLFRAFFVQGNVHSPALLGTLSILMYFIMAGALSSLMGVSGIAAAYALSWWLAFVASACLLWRGNIMSLFSADNLRYAWQLAVSLLLTGSVIFVGKALFVRPLQDIGFWGLAPRLCVVLGIGAMSFYFITVHVFRMSELQTVFGFVRDRLRLPR